MGTPRALAATIARECSVLRGPGAALVALSLVGCAAGRAAERAAPDPDLLTAPELAGGQEASVYEAVRRLRPRFLQSRGPNSLSLPSAGGPAVWVDGPLTDGLQWLHDVLPRDVVTIRRLSDWDAATTYGSRFTDGVIVVTTRP